MKRDVNENVHRTFSKGTTILVSGGCKSGKSRWAEHLVRNNMNVIYIATSSEKITSADWQERIRLHKERRPTEWEVIESDCELSNLIQSTKNKTLLIDSLGGFVTQCLDQDAKSWEQTSSSFLKIVENHNSKIIIVAEEAGWGVVPSTKIGNLFRDRLGLLTYKLDIISTKTWLVIQGRAVNLKKLGVRIPC